MNDRYLKKLGRLLLYNWGYIIWFSFYFVLSVFVTRVFVVHLSNAIILTGLVYGATISLALSPLGEALFRVISGIIPVITARDKHYLLPLFNEVYQGAMVSTPKLNKDIKLYIISNYSINAYAMGRKTIAITKGAIKGLNKNTLKGILAHEFGHIAHGNTKALIINNIGNGFFSLIIIAINLLIRFIDWILHKLQDADYIIFLFLS